MNIILCILGKVGASYVGKGGSGIFLSFNPINIFQVIVLNNFPPKGPNSLETLVWFSTKPTYGVHVDYSILLHITVGIFPTPFIVKSRKGMFKKKFVSVLIPYWIYTRPQPTIIN